MPSFYTVADSRHFVGAVALLNSLRLAGHDEPLFVVDAGLTPRQRAMLADHVVVIPGPDTTPAVFLKVYGPLRRPADVAVILDADVIVLRRLTELIDAAGTGRLVAFVNNEPNHDRFFDAWGAALALGPLRRQPYLAAGQLIVAEALTERLLRPWFEGQANVDIRETWVGHGTLSDPFYFADMDVFNAVAAAELDPEDIVTVEHRLAPHPPFTGLRLLDDERLLCAYADGAQPFVLHHVLAKPWLKATRTNIYSEVLPRLLLGSDVALRLSPHDVPLRLRNGQLGMADRRRADLQARAAMQLRAQLGRLGIRSRVARWRGSARWG